MRRHILIGVHSNREEPISPDTIIYKASAKLPEVTNDSYNGFHTNRLIAGSSYVSIKSHTFENGIGTIIAKKPIASLGTHVFFGCNTLTHIKLPSTLTRFVDNTFYGCVNLESINIPNSLEYIGELVFADCTKLKNINIPSNVTSISSSAFENATNLETITVSTENTIYDSRNNCNAIIKTSSNKLVIGCKNTIIPFNVTSIGSFAFYGQKELISINIPNNVTTIDSYAFYSTGLTSITIPENVTTIKSGALGHLVNITSIRCLSTTPPDVNISTPAASTFKTIAKNGILYVPHNSINLYSNGAWMNSSNGLGKYNWTIQALT